MREGAGEGARGGLVRGGQVGLGHLTTTKGWEDQRKGWHSCQRGTRGRVVGEGGLKAKSDQNLNVKRRLEEKNILPVARLEQSHLSRGSAYIYV